MKSLIYFVDCDNCANLSYQTAVNDALKSIERGLKFKDGTTVNNYGLAIRRRMDNATAPITENPLREPEIPLLNDAFDVSFYLRVTNIDISYANLSFPRAQLICSVVYWVKKKELGLSDLDVFEIFLNAFGQPRDVFRFNEAIIDPETVWAREISGEEIRSFDEYALGTINFTIAP